jgi:hypothetical protein
MAASNKDHISLVISIFKQEKEIIPKESQIYEILSKIEEELKEKDNVNRINLIISGGQIGADQEALEAAYKLGIPTGGWAPKAYVTSRGPMIRLKTVYHLKEVGEPVPFGYVTRSKKNVDESDATVAFRNDKIESVGTDKTIGYCKTGIWQTLKTYSSAKPYKPLLIIPIKSIDKFGDPSDFDKHIHQFREFIVENNVKTLNVCGSRSTGADMPVYHFLFTALSPFI